MPGPTAKSQDGPRPAARAASGRGRLPVLPGVPRALERAEPESLTILPTYRCSAACRECCFESHPGVRQRLSRDDLFSVIRRIPRELPRVRYVVLSGGEVTLLGPELLAALSVLTAEGLGSRIVSNGHWARTERTAERWAADLAAAGLSELNLSTGDDHREWIPVESVARAALSATRRGIRTVVSIEGRANATLRAEEFLALPQVQELLADEARARRLVMMTSVWMPFHEGTGIRGLPADCELAGCDNLFQNFGVNPHGFLVSCCGLTMEHIPRMKVGRLGDRGTLQQAYAAQFGDLLKLWIWLDGPRAVLERAARRGGAGVPEVSAHHCAACAQLHRDPSLRPALHALLAEEAAGIAFRAILKARQTGRTIDA